MIFQIGTDKPSSSRWAMIARAVVVLLAVLISYATTYAQAAASCKYCKPKVVIAFNGGFCSSGHYKLYINGTLVTSGTAACDAAQYTRSNTILAGLIQDVTYQIQVTGACSTHLNFFQVPEDYYLDFALGMQEIGYEGYTGYELCHPIPPVDGKPVGLDFADLNARLAAEYMRGVLAEATKAAVAGSSA